MSVYQRMRLWVAIKYLETIYVNKHTHMQLIRISWAESQEFQM